jgi:hypothetical protein
MRFQRISKERSCPVCKNVEVYRVKRAGFLIKGVCRILNLRPHWCPDCDTLFLGPKLSKAAGSRGSFGLAGGQQKDGGQPRRDGLPS